MGVTSQGEPTVIEHGFTHQLWEVRAYVSQGTPRAEGFESFRVFTVEEIADLGVAGPTLKALRAMGVPLAHRRGAG